MEDLDICWIKVISDSRYRTDLRNEASAKTGRQLAEISFVQKKMESVSNEKMEKVAKEMAMDHRTLQQTFSGLVFYHFYSPVIRKNLKSLLRLWVNPFTGCP